MLEKAGYKVIEQWECELKKDLKQNQNLQDLVNTMIWVLPLNPREAFYGGRTRMVSSLYQVCNKFVSNDQQVWHLSHRASNHCCQP